MKTAVNKIYLSSVIFHFTILKLLSH